MRAQCHISRSVSFFVASLIAGCFRQNGTKSIKSHVILGGCVWLQIQMPTCFGHAWSLCRQQKNYNLEPSFNVIQLLTVISKNDINTWHREMVLQQKQKSGWSLRRSRHHHGNLAVKHVHHKNAKTFSVSCSNRESQDATSRTYANYLQKNCFFKYVLMVPLTLVPPCYQVALRKSTFKFSGSSWRPALKVVNHHTCRFRKSILHPKLGCWATPHTLDSWWWSIQLTSVEDNPTFNWFQPKKGRRWVLSYSLRGVDGTSLIA